MPELLPNFSML